MIRYTLTYDLNGQHSTPVHPVDGGTMFSVDASDYKKRKKFDSKFKFQDRPAENIFDYTLLKSIENDNPFKRVILIIEKYNGISYNELIRGHFVIADCTVNDESCFYEIQPAVDDVYTCIDDIKDKEFNILSEVITAPPYIVNNPANLEYFTCEKDFVIYTGEYTPGCPRPISTTIDWITPIHNNVQYGSTLPDNIIGLPYALDALAGGSMTWGQDTNVNYHPLVYMANSCMYTSAFYPFVANNANIVAIVNMYRIYSNRFIIGTYAGTANYYNVKLITTWCIESAITINDPQTGAGIPPTGAGWLPFYQLTQGGLLATKWGREAFYNNQVYEYYITENHCFDYTWTLVNPYTNSPAGHVDIYRGRLLNDVVQMFLNKANCNLQYKSKFYKDDINPVTNERNAFYVLNDGSDCKAPIPSSPAIWNFTTFDRLLNNLKIIHNIEWYIDGNDFIIEHIKYFENGYSYTQQANAITDLRSKTSIQTGKAEIVRTNKYSYDKGNIFRQEKISNSNYVDFDFSPIFIDYDIQITKDSNIDQKGIDYVLDFAGIYNNPSYFSNDDIVMVAYRLELIDPINNIKWPVVINEPGYRTNEEVTNGYLCLSNLFNRFWRNQRQLLTGIVENRTEQFFTKTGKILQQISVKDCDLDYFNNYTHFITNLGTGRMVNAKHNLQLGTTEITILI